MLSQRHYRAKNQHIKSLKRRQKIPRQAKWRNEITRNKSKTSKVTLSTPEPHIEISST